MRNSVEMNFSFIGPVYVFSNRLFQHFMVSKIEKFDIVGKRRLSSIIYIGLEKNFQSKKFMGVRGGAP